MIEIVIFQLYFKTIFRQNEVHSLAKVYIDAHSYSIKHRGAHPSSYQRVHIINKILQTKFTVIYREISVEACKFGNHLHPSAVVYVVRKLGSLATKRDVSTRANVINTSPKTAYYY